MNTAMILAAGRGERLRPLTNQIPKALCLVQGKPLIEHHVMNLAAAGFEKIIINHAYLGGQIRQHLGDGSRWHVDIQYSPETPGGLETGGGIVNALPLLGEKPFITVNADIYTHFDFKQLLAILERVSCIHLVLVNNSKKLSHYGDFGLEQECIVTNTDKQYTFAGIACYNPNILKHLQFGRYSVTPLIRQYVTERKVTGQWYSGTWFDIGSIERLNAANTYALNDYSSGNG